MKLTAKVKLQPSPEQFVSLARTLAIANEVCNYISERAWETKTFGQFSIHKLVYHDVKERFHGISAQVIVRCIAKVCDAYKLDKKVKRTFKPTGSIAYDDRILSWKLDENIVSIWTMDGRKKISFACTERAKELLSGKRGESDLLLMKGNFYLFTSCEVDEPAPDDVDDILGVDMGVVNIAVDSDKQVFSSKGVNNVRFRHRRLRTKLQKLGTKASRRKLRQLSGKESRFANDANHVISKAIVQKAKGTGRAIAIEELGGIRDRTQFRKAQRTQLHSWSFAQLRLYIEYKSKLVGVRVIPVDPRNTSRTCPCCGHIDKANRKTQALFLCVDCGYSAHADTVAAGNIRSRAFLSMPIVSYPSNQFQSDGVAGTSQRALVVGN